MPLATERSFAAPLSTRSRRKKLLRPTLPRPERQSLVTRQLIRALPNSGSSPEVPVIPQPKDLSDLKDKMGGGPSTRRARISPRRTPPTRYKSPSPDSPQTATRWHPRHRLLTLTITPRHTCNVLRACHCPLAMLTPHPVPPSWGRRIRISNPCLRTA